METKICYDCKKELTINNFGKDKQRKDGLCLYCKECWRERTRKWNEENRSKKLLQKKKYYNKNKEKILEKAKEPNVKARIKQYRQNNKEKLAERARIYCKNNKEKMSIKSKKHYNKNKEKIKIYSDKYRKDNAELLAQKANSPSKREYRKQYYKIHAIEHCINTKKREAKKRKLLATLTKEQWEYIKIYFNNRCCYCGREIFLEQDHFKPLSKLGEFTVNNIVCACKTCNCSKHNSEFSKWYPNYKYYSKKREQKILKFLGYNDDNQQLRII